MSSLVIVLVIALSLMGILFWGVVSFIAGVLFGASIMMKDEDE